MTAQQTWRFPIILGISVVFGMPALQDLMLQPEQLLRAGLSYLGALGLSWLGVNAIFTLIEHYSEHNRRVRQKREKEAIAEELRASREEEAAADARPESDAAPPKPKPKPEPAMAAAGSGAAPRPLAEDLLREETEAGAVI